MESGWSVEMGRGKGMAALVLEAIHTYAFHAAHARKHRNCYITELMPPRVRNILTQHHVMYVRFRSSHTLPFTGVSNYCFLCRSVLETSVAWSRLHMEYSIMSSPRPPFLPCPGIISSSRRLYLQLSTTALHQCR